MKSDLALNVKEICRRKGWQLKELADIVGTTQAAVSHAVNGNPTLETVIKIANALGVSPTRLLQRKTDITGYVTIEGHHLKFESISELADIVGPLETPNEPGLVRLEDVKEWIRGNAAKYISVPGRVNINGMAEEIEKYLISKTK